MASDKGVGDPELLKILTDVRARTGVPAMAAALVTSRGLERVAAVGTRKAGTDVPVTLDDLWHIGSDTKIMTSTLVAELVEQGKLAWTTTVSEVFPDLADGFDPSARSITILQLLSHVAGLPRNIDFDAIDTSLPVRAQRIEAVKMALQAKPLSVPGRKHLYSNIGYVIVGAIIERVLDTDWEAAMTENVFIPLKMSSAGFGGLGTPGEIDQPWGHEAADKPDAENGPDADNPEMIGPAGRVHCTIQDWALFVADQLRGSRGQSGLLKPQSYQMLQTTHFGGDYTLGWGAVWRLWAGGKALNHAGSNGYYFALVWIAPAKDFAILVCTNEGPDSLPAVEEVHSKIRSMVGKLKGT
jgi:CubicO group peptidase (beta-lactamase class C family)